MRCKKRLSALLGPPEGFGGTRDRAIFAGGIRDTQEFSSGIRDKKIKRDAGLPDFSRRDAGLPTLFGGMRDTKRKSGILQISNKP